MGIGDRSAFPEHLDTKEEVEKAFPDDDQYKGWLGRLWRKWNKATKHWDAFGPRSPKGVAFSMWPPFIVTRKWRETPVVLIASRGDGYWRLEKDGQPDLAAKDLDNIPKGYYLSRNQLWCRSHWQLQWPLFFCWHRYNETAQVIPVNSKEDRDGQIKMFYAGAKRDADRMYWWIALFPGENYK